MPASGSSAAAIFLLSDQAHHGIVGYFGIRIYLWKMVSIVAFVRRSDLQSFSEKTYDHEERSSTMIM